MSERRLNFPDGFLWGAATSAHQNEGDNRNNDFWAWEHIPGHVADQTTSGSACDWWLRAEEDFDRAASLHLNALRIGVEWSRIEPEPGNWDSGAIDRYREMLKALHSRNISPMITLHHFTNPLWLRDKGGWTNAQAAEFFARYAKRVAASLGDLCRMWCTINEPNVYAAYAYLLGSWPPGETNIQKSFVATRHLTYAHAAAYHAIKEIQPHAQIGLVQHMADFHPSNARSWPNRWVTGIRSTIFNWRIVEAVLEGRLKFPLGLGKLRENLYKSNDYLGLNYYGRHLVKFNPRSLATLFAEEAQAAAEVAWPEPWTDREIYPEGIYHFIRNIHKRYRIPVYVTENGMADADDTIRPGYILTHLAAVWRALAEGADVRGYYYWTLVDNYEWTEGWTTRFGLVSLNPQTQKRSILRSAELFSEIAGENAITREMVENYAPAAMAQVFRK